MVRVVVKVVMIKVIVVIEAVLKLAMVVVAMVVMAVRKNTPKDTDPSCIVQLYMSHIPAYTCTIC